MQFEVANTANQALQGEINRSIIFNYIRENGPVARMEIARSLHISPSAVSRVINALMGEKYVVETEKVETPVGKRPTLLRINGDQGRVLAVDLSQDRVQVALYDFAGNLLRKHKGFRILGRRESADELLEEVQQFLERYLQESRLSFKRLGLGAIGVGVPADIDSASGRILSACLYQAWYDVNFKEMFERKFRTPTLLEKDVTLSVLAEKRVGAGRRNRNLAFIEISNGVSAGIICNDQLIRGSSGSAGQIAFSVINSESERFRGTNMGYLDQQASMKSLRERTYIELHKGRPSALRELPEFAREELDASMVCRAALEGDQLAREVIGAIVGLLSNALINLVLAVNPEVLILGGHVSTLPGAQELFGREIARRIAEAIPFRVPEIKISAFGEEVVLVGASMLAVEALTAGEFPYRLGSAAGA
jgi:N-acetylglucosamine repressor